MLVSISNNKQSFNKTRVLLLKEYNITIQLLDWHELFDLHMFRYVGEVGDVVIGRITELGNKRWKVDANTVLDAALMLSCVNLPGGELVCIIHYISNILLDDCVLENYLRCSFMYLMLPGNSCQSATYTKPFFKHRKNLHICSCALIIRWGFLSMCLFQQWMWHHKDS